MMGVREVADPILRPALHHNSNLPASSPTLEAADVANVDEVDTHNILHQTHVQHVRYVA